MSREFVARILRARDADGRQGAPPRRQARPPACRPGDGPPRVWNVATTRFPGVTQADLAELELDQVRQLAHAHYAGEYTGKAPSYFRCASEADTSEEATRAWQKCAKLSTAVGARAGYVARFGVVPALCIAGGDASRRETPG